MVNYKKDEMNVVRSSNIFLTILMDNHLVHPLYGALDYSGYRGVGVRGAVA